MSSPQERQDRGDRTGVTGDDRSAGRRVGAGDVGRATRRGFLRTATAGVGLAALGGSSNTVGAAIEHGVPTPRLHTDGKWIRDPDGDPVTLRGYATASLDFVYYDWYPWTVREILEKATDRSDDGWYPNHLRLPCEIGGIREHGGVEPFVEDVLRPAVDYLAARNTYALIDYHLIRPYTQQATEDYNADQSSESDTYDPIDDVMTEFWSVVAPEFADDEHVLFELFNEPTYPLQWSEYGQEVTTRERSWEIWKDAAQPWVDLVQEHAPETPLVIGSPNWTSETQFAPSSPFDGENLIYSGHIYPANGQPSEFDPEYGVPAEDVPVWITEFGWEPNGGQVDQGTTSGWGEPFREWVESYENMSWSAWCFDDSWAPAFFESPADNPQQGAARPWALKDGEDEHGGYIKSWLAETAGSMDPAPGVDDSQPPSPPSSVAVDSVGETTATVTWEAATDVGGAGVTHYRVSVDGEDRGVVLPGESFSHSLSHLEPDSVYEVSVVAVDDLDNVSDPATATVETVPYGSQQEPHDGPNAVPGTIQAEDFDRGGQGSAYFDTTDGNAAGADYRDTGTDVDVGSNDASGTGGYHVGYVNQGEWLEYTIDVETPGTYEMSVSVSNGGNSTHDPALSVHVDREQVGTTQVWPTNGWTSFSDIRVGEFDLDAGRQILRVAAESSGWNFDAFTLSLVEARELEPPTSPADQWTNEVTATSIDLGWTAVDDATSYVVSLDGSEYDSTASTSTTITGLSPDTENVVGIASSNAEGTSEAVTTTITTEPEGSGEPDPEDPTCGGQPVNATATVDGQTVCDVDGDGLYRDVDGNGQVSHADVQEFFSVQHRPTWKQPSAFDFNENEVVGHGDVVALFEDVATGGL